MSVGNKISQSAYRPDITVWVEIGNINVIGVTGSYGGTDPGIILKSDWVWLLQWTLKSKQESEYSDTLRPVVWSIDYAALRMK